MDIIEEVFDYKSFIKQTKLNIEQLDNNTVDTLKDIFNRKMRMRILLEKKEQEISDIICYSKNLLIRKYIAWG